MTGNRSLIDPDPAHFTAIKPDSPRRPLSTHEVECDVCVISNAMGDEKCGIHGPTKNIETTAAAS
jgi:hypothetical protein